MSVNKILFFSNKSFSINSGGSILFSRLFEGIHNSNISWFVCDDTLRNKGLSFRFSKIYNFYSIVFSNHLINLISRRVYFIGIVFYYFKYKILPYVIFFRFRNVFYEYDKNWFYLTQQTIPLARIIHSKLNINYHLSIQDDFSTHLLPNEYNYLFDDFRYLLENASSIDFISEYAEEYYKNIYNVRGKTISFLISKVVKSKSPIISENILKIGYAGNIWCGDTLYNFLHSLKIYNSFNSHKLHFVMFSSISPKSSIFKHFDDFIQLNPLVQYNVLVKELQKCDFLYLPMSFENNCDVVNITSFPSKIVTYLNCKIPILNHSPIQASSHKFVSRKQIGVSINSNNVNEIVNSLSSIIEYYSIDYRINFSKNMDRVMKEFESEININRLTKLIFDE